MDFIVVEESGVFSPILIIQCSMAFLETVFPETFVPKMYNYDYILIIIMIFY